MTGSRSPSFAIKGKNGRLLPLKVKRSASFNIVLKLLRFKNITLNVTCHLEGWILLKIGVSIELLNVSQKPPLSLKNYNFEL